MGTLDGLVKVKVVLFDTDKLERASWNVNECH